MTDLELLVIGAMVTFLSVAGAYVAIRHRANEMPVDSFKPGPHSFKARNEWYAQGDTAQQSPSAHADRPMN